MEDVLEVYQRPYDPKRPQVCIDETSKQLLEHTRIPIPTTPGTPARVDDAEKIVVVMDNLNTHAPASLYEAFPPSEARRLVKKLEIHYTPKHGSWLDIAEIELSVLSRQCLQQRIGAMVELQGILQSWEEQRNKEVKRVTLFNDRCGDRAMVETSKEAD